MASTAATVSFRLLSNFVRLLPWLVSVLPCSVTVFCNNCSALASAFLLTLAFVVDRPFSSAVVRLPMLLSVSPCTETVVVRESTAFAVASAVFCALCAAVTLRRCQSAAYQTVPKGELWLTCRKGRIKFVSAGTVKRHVTRFHAAVTLVFPPESLALIPPVAEVALAI